MNSEQINKLAEELQGTANDLDEVLFSLFGMTFTDMSLTDCAMLDDIVMCCESCNWWCESGEIDDDQICDDCR